MKTKKCFSCKKDLPLSDFKRIDKEDYQQKSWLGRLINCRECNIVIELNKGVVRRVNGKFQVLDWSKEQIIKDNMI
jgi:hypothetical protein